MFAELERSWRNLSSDIHETANTPPTPLTFKYVAAILLRDVLRHPVRFAVIMLAVSFLGWLSGYDVR